LARAASNLHIADERLERASRNFKKWSQQVLWNMRERRLGLCGDRRINLHPLQTSLSSNFGSDDLNAIALSATPTTLNRLDLLFNNLDRLDL
jgi:hypothetical protein